PGAAGGRGRGSDRNPDTVPRGCCGAGAVEWEARAVREAAGADAGGVRRDRGGGAGGGTGVPDRVRAAVRPRVGHGAGAGAGGRDRAAGAVAARGGGVAAAAAVRRLVYAEGDERRPADGERQP